MEWQRVVVSPVGWMKAEEGSMSMWPQTGGRRQAGASSHASSGAMRQSDPHASRAADDLEAFEADGMAVTQRGHAVPRLPATSHAPAVRSQPPTSSVPPISDTLAARAAQALNGPVTNLIVALVPLTLLAAILWGIWNRTPHVPFYDEWQNVDMVLHFKQGTLQFADFWAFHNEHRIVFPRMLDLALIELTHWNDQLMMTFDLCIAVAEAALLLAAVRRGLRSTGWMIALTAPIALLVFSFGQYENWLWAFQITFICTTFGVALSVYAFARRGASWPMIALAMAGALFAAWSSVGGTMAWIAFAPAAWRAGRLKGAVWSAVGAVVLITYFQGFPHTVPLHPSLGMLGFSLGYLGAPLGMLSVKWSLFFGAASVVFVLANLYYYWRTRGGGIALDAWLGLALFALAVDGVTTLGRYQLFGLSDFLTSRYQVFSVLWWVALIVLAAINCRTAAQAFRATERERLERAPVAIWLGNALAIGVCCVALLASSLAYWPALESYLYTQRLDEVCVANYQTAPDNCLRGFIWDPAYLRTEAAILDKYHLSIFNNNVGTTRPLIEYINSKTGDEWATTELMDPQSGYAQAQWLGLLYVNAHDGTRPLYQCVMTSAHTHFVSLDAGCERQTPIGIEGWIYTAPAPNDLSTPLYRCTAGADSFVWPDASCNGKKMDEPLGYILSQQIPWAD